MINLTIEMRNQIKAIDSIAVQVIIFLCKKCVTLLIIAVKQNSNAIAIMKLICVISYLLIAKTLQTKIHLLLSFVLLQFSGKLCL
jgi:hypothetical protein